MSSEIETTAETVKTSILGVADGKATVQDANGRVIVVSKLDALGYYRLTKLLGPAASNPATMDLAMLAASVKKIDTNHISASTEIEIQHTLQMLDFAGLNAVGEGLKALSEESDAEIEAAKN